MAPIKVWELAGADPKCVFSPFCWASRLALIHKGLEYESVPWRFVDKTKLKTVSGQDLVPIIEDNGKVVNDSFAIAQYLESTYTERPSLFGGPGGEASALFVLNWALHALVVPTLGSLLLMDVHNCLTDDDKVYFRKQREERFGKTLEEVCPESEKAAKRAAFQKALEPLRQMLGKQPFLGGHEPLYTDITVFSFFMWAKSISPIHLLEADDPVYAWRERMLDAFGGVGRKAVGFPV